MSKKTYNNNAPRDTNSSRSVVVPGQVTTAVNDIPVPFQMDVSEAANNIHIEYGSDAEKFTPASPDKIVNNKHILAMHWFNGPLIDMHSFVTKYTRIMFESVHNYDLQNHRSWFLLNQELLILKSTEEQYRFNSDWLIANYKMLCARLIEYYYHYYQSCVFFFSAELNFTTWAIVDGSQEIGRWKGAFKFSDQMSAFTSVDQWVMPIGMQKSMIYASARARGQLADKTEVTSLAYWRDDIYGNVANHSIPMSSILTPSGGSSNADGSNIGIIDYNSEDLRNLTQADLANKLMDNIQLAITEYGWGKFKPHDPRVENSSELIVDGVAIKLNNDGNVTRDGEYVTNIIDNIKQSVSFWREYRDANFQAMKTPGSKIRQYAVQTLGLFENSMSHKDVSDMLRKLKDVDINALYQKMMYRRDNQVNCATIVKYMPLMGGTIGDAFSDAGIELNLNRCNAHLEDHALAIKQSLMYPRLSPTVFAGGDSLAGISTYPLVCNTIQRVGTLMHMQKSFSGIIGPDATLFDIAQSDGFMREEKRIEAIGVSGDWLKKYVSLGGGDIYRENPDNIVVKTMPLIDTSDPFQCGFNVIISYDMDKETNPWVRYFLDPSNYDNGLRYTLNGVQKTPNDDIPDTAIGTFAYPTVKTYHIERSFDPLDPKRIVTRYTKRNAQGEAIDPTYKLQHVTCSQYLTGIQDALIFVGASLFESPFTAKTNMSAGHPEFFLATPWGENSDGDPVDNSLARSFFSKIQLDAQKVSAQDLLRMITTASCPENNVTLSDLESSELLPQTRAPKLIGDIERVLPAGGGRVYSEMLFSSMYDDVAPVTPDFPYTSLILRGSGTMQQSCDMEASYDAGQPKIWDIFQMQQSSLRFDKKVLEVGMVNPSLMWLWWITGFAYQPVFRDVPRNREVISREILNDAKDPLIRTTDVTMYAIHRMLRIAISFVGEDDLPSIDLDSYTEDIMHQETFKLPFVSGTPETSVVAEGAPSFTTSAPKRNNVNRYRANKPGRAGSTNGAKVKGVSHGRNQQNTAADDKSAAEAELKTATQTGNDITIDGPKSGDIGDQSGTSPDYGNDPKVKRNTGESPDASNASGTD